MVAIMDHIVLNVTDDEKMMAFYSEVLGLPPERLDDYRRDACRFRPCACTRTLSSTSSRGRCAEGEQGGRQGSPNLNHFCLAMSRSDWEELRGRLDKHRVRIEQGPVARWGAHGTATSIYFRDPEGNTVEARFYDGPDDSTSCKLSS